MDAATSANGHVAPSEHKKAKDTRPVLFVDIDNTLYSKSKKVHDMMGELIDKYFTTHLSVTPAESTKLHTSYYLTYGLAIEGLVRHHHIDPLAYNSQVDDALPLETVLHPDPELLSLLQSVDRTKVKLWLFTNAYVNHARRVVRLLGIGSGGTAGEGGGGGANGVSGGQGKDNSESEESEGNDGLGPFEGLTYCDYGAATATDPVTGEMQGFVCKPQRGMFEKAMREAGVEDPKACYFVDDSHLNCRAAANLGWTAAHLVEPDDKPPVEKASQYQISNLRELRTCFPQFFKDGEGEGKGKET